MYKIDNRKKKNRGRYTVLGIVLGIILTLGGVYVYDNYKNTLNDKVTQIQQVIVKQIPKTNDIQQIVKSNPIIQRVEDETIKNNGITQPTQTTPITNTYSLDELKQITLNDINNYRVQNGLSQIKLENAKASQVWADHLLSEGCISHRESNSGPIQRYIDNGDKLQMVFENVAGGYGTNWATPDEAIKQSNSDMMNNDFDQNNAHRNNILNPNHLSVSIGIAYNSNKLILVEDFQEPLYEDWKSFDMAYDDGKSCW